MWITFRGARENRRKAAHGQPATPVIALAPRSPSAPRAYPECGFPPPDASRPLCPRKIGIALWRPLRSAPKGVRSLSLVRQSPRQLSETCAENRSIDSWIDAMPATACSGQAIGMMSLARRIRGCGRERRKIDRRRHDKGGPGRITQPGPSLSERENTRCGQNAPLREREAMIID